MTITTMKKLTPELEAALAKYFVGANHPCASSPIGLAMRELLQMVPTLNFEMARALIREAGPGEPKEIALRIFAKLPREVTRATKTSKPRNRFKPSFDRDRAGIVFGNGRRFL
jgi:hypothetical protein